MLQKDIVCVGLKASSLYLFTKVLKWSKEKLQVHLAHVRKDLGRPGLRYSCRWIRVFGQKPRNDAVLPSLLYCQQFTSIALPYLSTTHNLILRPANEFPSQNEGSHDHYLGAARNTDNAQVAIRVQRELDPFVIPSPKHLAYAIDVRNIRHTPFTCEISGTRHPHAIPWLLQSSELRNAERERGYPRQIVPKLIIVTLVLPLNFSADPCSPPCDLSSGLLETNTSPRLSLMFANDLIDQDSISIVSLTR